MKCGVPHNTPPVPSSPVSGTSEHNCAVEGKGRRMSEKGKGREERGGEGRRGEESRVEGR